MIAFSKGEIPFTLLLLPFLAGLGLCVAYPCCALLRLLWLLFGLLSLVFIGLNLSYQKLNLHRVKWLGGLLVGTILFLAGMIAFENNREINAADHFSKTQSRYLIGYISNEPKLNNGVLRFIFKVEQGGDTAKLQSITGNLLVSVKLDTARQINLLYGDRLIIPGKATPVVPPLNPAEFDYKNYLANQNIYQQSFLIQQQVKLLEHHAGNPLIAAALQLRLHLVGKLKAAIRDTDGFAVASTMILGYRADLRPDVRETYAKTGTMHLLSVAGMHVGLVYLLIIAVLSLLPNGKHTKLIKAVISIALIWCYALITGFNPPVSRAALMLTLFIIGFSFNRHINRLNLLAVSAFILLLYNPFYITDAGFQLSYLAVFGIIIIQPYIYKWIDTRNRIARQIWLVCSVSISAQIILFPIAAAYFHNFPVYFLLSNVFVVIPSAIVMYAGIVFLALPYIPVISPALGWLLEQTTRFMTKTLAIMEHAPFSSISKIWLSPFEFLLAYAIIIGALCFFTLRSKAWLKFTLVLCLLISVSLSVKAYRASATQSITFFSLHKNTAMLFKNGNSAILVTDLSPKDKAYQYSIQPCLDSCRIINLQCLSLDGDTTTSYMAKHGHLVTLGNKTALIFNKALEAKIFRDKLNIDYIYITGNPHTNLQYLKQNYNFKLLVAGASNLNRVVDTLQKQAAVLKVNFLNLKRNKSLILVSDN